MAAPNNITSDFFLAMFDEFASVPIKKIEVYIALASARVPASVWRNATQMATAYLAAHMIAVGGGNAGPSSGAGGASGGALTAESVGDLSRSFAQLGADKGVETFMTTRYGQAYVELRRENVVGALHTGCPPFPPGTLA